MHATSGSTGYARAVVGALGGAAVYVVTLAALMAPVLDALARNG